MGIRCTRMILIGVPVRKRNRAVPICTSSRSPEKRAAISRSFRWEVRQTSKPLSHVGEAFDRLGKTVNGSVGITMFNAVTHTVFDMSLKNNAAAAVQS